MTSKSLLIALTLTIFLFGYWRFNVICSESNIKFNAKSTKEYEQDLLKLIEVSNIENLITTKKIIDTIDISDDSYDLNLIERFLRPSNDTLENLIVQLDKNMFFDYDATSKRLQRKIKFDAKKSRVFLVNARNRFNVRETYIYSTFNSQLLERDAELEHIFKFLLDMKFKSVSIDDEKYEKLTTALEKIKSVDEIIVSEEYYIDKPKVLSSNTEKRHTGDGNQYERITNCVFESGTWFGKLYCFDTKSKKTTIHYASIGNSTQVNGKIKDNMALLLSNLYENVCFSLPKLINNTQ
jgi:hypothetical protein